MTKLLFIVILLFFSTPVFSLQEIYQNNTIALDGLDVITYYTEDFPEQGLYDFRTFWKGANWIFTNKDHMYLFEAFPNFFAPEYGGYDALAISQGFASKSTPTIWHITNDKLYLHYSPQTHNFWIQNATQNIQLGNNNWTNILIEEGHIDR